jgi:hypothetical protein
MDTSHLIRNLSLIGLISLGAPIASCTIVEEDDDDDDRKAVIREDRVQDEDAKDADD